MIYQFISSFDPRIVGLAVVILFTLLMVGFYIHLRNRNWKMISGQSLRRISAFRSLRQSLWYAVEAGKRIHLTLGSGGIVGMPAASGFVGLDLQGIMTEFSANSDKPVLTTSGDGSLSVLSQDTAHHAFAGTNRSDRYDPTIAQLTGVSPFSYAAGTIPVILDQDVSSSVLVGHFGTETALIVEPGLASSTTTIGGSDDLTGQAVLFVTTEDYLIGEETFAAGAYFQHGAMHLASLRAQDIFRWIIVFTIIIGAILKLTGVI